jgi:hypothetical protein
MQKLEIYRLLHFAGIFTLFFSFGSLFIGKNYNKGAAMAHGVGLILILVSGFGMQATMNLGFPVWLILKIVIWVVFGGFIVLAKKSVINGFTAWVLITALALGAVYLAKTHPKLGIKAKVTETK